MQPLFFSFNKIFILLFFLLSNSLYADGMTDAELKAQIVNFIPAESRVEVMVAEKNVSLQGMVLTTNDASQFMKQIAAIPGVKTVNIDKLINQNGKQPLSDDIVNVLVASAYVKSGLFGDIDILSLPVFIKTYNHIVYLTGIVDNADQRIQIIKLALKVKGVKRVISTAHLRFVTYPVSH